MEVTLVGASWVVVAGGQAGCGLHSYEALWSTELPCARGRGPVWRGAGGRVPYRLPGSPSKWRVFRRTSCMQTPDGLPMAEVDPLGDSVAES